jgi:hypothetical protein
VARTLLGLGAIVLFEAPAAAQAGRAVGAAPGDCYGFTFGPWSPPLDPRAAGGGARRPPRANEWAVQGSAHGDSTLILFPSWWPPGVGIRFAGSTASSDTLSGVATAFVADGRVRRPTSTVRAWRIPCGSGGADSSQHPDSGREPRRG